MSNEQMFQLIKKFKTYLFDTKKLSPMTYQIAVEVLDIFYWWYVWFGGN